jgi:hypothetical protein
VNDRAIYTTLERFRPLALALGLTLLTWIFCWHDRQITENTLTARGFSDRHLSDLYPRWLGTQQLLLFHKDPYSAEITGEIQRGYYGRPIDKGRATDPIDEQRFAYPLFVVFLLAPTVLVKFSVVQGLFALLLLFLAIWTVLLWTSALALKLRTEWKYAVVLLALATVPYAEGIELQQLSLLVAFLLAWAFRNLARGRLTLAGVLFALATIKPQLSLPLICSIFVWAFSEWQLRKRVLKSFAWSMTALLGGSEMLLPGWHREFVAGLGSYLRYTQATSGVQELLGRTAANLFTLLLAIVVIVTVWKWRREPADSAEFTLAVVLVLGFSSAAVPSLAPHNEVLLLPAYLLLAKERMKFWQLGRLARAFFYAAWMAILWPWVSVPLLFVWVSLSGNRMQSIRWSLPLDTNPLIPILAFAALIPLVFQRYRQSPVAPRVVRASAV